MKNRVNTATPPQKGKTPPEFIKKRTPEIRLNSGSEALPSEWKVQGSNLRPFTRQANALPAELTFHVLSNELYYIKLISNIQVFYVFMTKIIDQ